MAVAGQPRLAAGVGRSRGQVLRLQPVAVAAREAGEAPGLRQEGATGAGGAVGDLHVAAAHDVACFGARGGERGRSEGGFLRGHSRSGRPRQQNAISFVMPVGRKSSTKE